MVEVTNVCSPGTTATFRLCVSYLWRVLWRGAWSLAKCEIPQLVFNGTFWCFLVVTSGLTALWNYDSEHDWRWSVKRRGRKAAVNIWHQHGVYYRRAGDPLAFTGVHHGWVAM